MGQATELKEIFPKNYVVVYRPEYIKTQLFWRAIGEQYSGARAKVTVIGYIYLYHIYTCRGIPVLH